MASHPVIDHWDRLYLLGLGTIALAMVTIFGISIREVAAVHDEIRQHRAYIQERDRAWAPHFKATEENQQILREIKADLEKPK